MCLPTHPPKQDTGEIKIVSHFIPCLQKQAGLLGNKPENCRDPRGTLPFLMVQDLF